MSRLSFFVRHPSRTLSGLAVVAAAAGLTIGSGANFTATAANASGVFATGNIALTDNAQTNGTGSWTNAATIVSASNMKPGSSTTGLVAIQNTGSLAGTLALTATGVTTNALATDLVLTISTCSSWTSPATAPTTCPTATQVYSGTLAAAVLPATTLNGGQGELYQFTVTLPSGAANGDQGLSTQAGFSWNATNT